MGIARLEIESGLSQTGKGIAVDAPGGDPAELFAYGLFESNGGWERLVSFGLLSGQRLRNRGQTQSHLSPGIQVVDQSWRDVELFN
ncbi:hypothetical protein D3C86_2011550 [compost metagenome]